MGFSSSMQFLRDILTLTIIVVIVAALTTAIIYSTINKTTNTTSERIPILKNLIPFNKECYYNGQPINCKTMDQELLKKETSSST